MSSATYGFCNAAFGSVAAFFLVVATITATSTFALPNGQRPIPPTFENADVRFPSHLGLRRPRHGGDVSSTSSSAAVSGSTNPFPVYQGGVSFVPSLMQLNSSRQRHEASGRLENIKKLILDHLGRSGNRSLSTTAGVPVPLNPPTLLPMYDAGSMDFETMTARTTALRHRAVQTQSSGQNSRVKGTNKPYRNMVGPEIDHSFQHFDIVIPAESVTRLSDRTNRESTAAGTEDDGIEMAFRLIDRWPALNVVRAAMEIVVSHRRGNAAAGAASASSSSSSTEDVALVSRQRHPNQRQPQKQNSDDNNTTGRRVTLYVYQVPTSVDAAPSSVPIAQLTANVRHRRSTQRILLPTTVIDEAYKSGAWSKAVDDGMSGNFAQQPVPGPVLRLRVVCPACSSANLVLTGATTKKPKNSRKSKNGQREDVATQQEVFVQVSDGNGGKDGRRRSRHRGRNGGKQADKIPMLFVTVKVPNPTTATTSSPSTPSTSTTPPSTYRGSYYRRRLQHRQLASSESR